MAALDFPTSPSGGDTYAGYIYNATKGVWQWEVVDPSLASLSDTTITSATADDLLQYDGTDWVNVDVNTALGAGKILQVVSATKTDSFTTTSTSFVDVTGVTVSITPTATTSKVLVFVSGTAGNTNANRLGRINLLRDATNVAQSTGGTSNQTLTVFTGNADNGDSFAISFLDSPNTTSATTYKIQANTNNADGTFVVGRYAFSGNQPSVTTITAMEVAG